jgi:hypothetical protein
VLAHAVERQGSARLLLGREQVGERAGQVLQGHPGPVAVGGRHPTEPVELRDVPAEPIILQVPEQLLVDGLAGEVVLDRQLLPVVPAADLPDHRLGAPAADGQRLELPGQGAGELLRVGLGPAGRLRDGGWGG